MILAATALRSSTKTIAASCVGPMACWMGGSSQGKLQFHLLSNVFTSYLGCGPLTVTVTTRIITFLIGNPYKPSFTTVTVRGATSKSYQHQHDQHEFDNLSLLFFLFKEARIYIYIISSLFPMGPWTMSSISRSLPKWISRLASRQSSARGNS